MAGSASNWYKVREGPLKGQTVYLAKAQRGVLSRSEAHGLLQGGFKPLVKLANTQTPLGAAKSGPARPDGRRLISDHEDPPPRPQKKPKAKPYPSEAFWSSVTTGKPGPTGSKQSKLDMTYPGEKGKGAHVQANAQSLLTGPPLTSEKGAPAPGEKSAPKPFNTFPYHIAIPGGVQQKAAGGNPDKPEYIPLKNGLTVKNPNGPKTDLIFPKSADAGLLPNEPVINGVKLQSVAKDSWRQHQDVDIAEPPLPDPPTFSSYDKRSKTTIQKPKAQSTGVLIQEDDGRIWLYEPTNHFGGYYHTFPKGRLEPGLTPQQNARKEVREELGMDVKITGYLADAEGDVTTTRYYLAKRVGGTPSDAHWEADNVKLVSPATAAKLLNRARDQKLLTQFLALPKPKKAKTPKH